MPRDNKDEKLLREIRDRFSSYAQFWSENYHQGDLDMDSISAEYGPWDPEEVRRRKDAQRPICHIDITSQFNRRIVNQARLNPRGIVITPKGSDATDETAEMREDRIRQIDYESMAVQARINAIQNAVDRGIGFYMVTTDYIHHDSFDQKIGTRQIPNSKSVLVDPHAKEVDWSDMKGAFVSDRYEYGKYRAEFPTAAVRSFSDAYLTIAPGWIDDTSIQVCEYWCVKPTLRKLLLLRSPEGMVKRYLDEMDGAKIKGEFVDWNGTKIAIEKQRDSEEPTVWQYITNGVEILKTVKWIGSTIPVIMVTGYRKYEKGKLVIESCTRKLRAPQLLYDYACTGEQEVLGMTPKSHWEAVVGQTEEFHEWDDANRDPVAVLRYRAKTAETGETILGPPNRVDYEPPISAFEEARRSALIAAQQAAGMFSVERQNKADMSGKAQKELNNSQDIGNYHFSDYLDLAVAYEGRIKNEILRHVEDTDTMRGFRKADDSYDRKQVTPMLNQETGEIEKHPYGKGRDHDVMVKAGPTTDSQWEKASDFLDVIAQNPQYAPMVMDLVVQMKQLGPMGKKLAERFEKMLPPALQEKKEGEQQQLPPEIQQQLEQLKQALQMTTQQLNEEKQASAMKQQELDAKVQMNQENNATKLAVAEISAKVKESADSVAAFVAKQEHVLELLMQEREHMHQQGQQDSQQRHATDQQDQQLGAQQDQAAAQEQLQREQMANQGTQL